MKCVKLLLIGMLLFTIKAYCPTSKAITIFEAKPLKPYEKAWDATCRVETNFDPLAIGDKHLKQKSYGIVQIRQTRLDDYYRQTGIRYSIKDIINVEKSKEVFMFYACKYHPEDVESIVRCWNGGQKGMRKMSTKKYYKKILAVIEK